MEDALDDDGAGPAPGSPHTLDWLQGDVPMSTLFDDPFFSRRDGRAEVEHVFLAGNGLPERWRAAENFAIGELGFGTGLNFVETWRTWLLVERRPGQRLSFTSFEAYPLPPQAMRRAVSPWPELAPLADALVEAWAHTDAQPVRRMELDGGVDLTVVIGDAMASLERWEGAADAWYLDGFSPAKNAAMWSDALMREVARHTRPGGSFATYSAAGWVRRNLAAAGFDVVKKPGHGGKREMACGRLRACSPVAEACARPLAPGEPPGR